MSQEHVMDGKTYIVTQMRIIEMGKIADSLDLDAFLKCIENAEKMAPLVDQEIVLKAQANIKAVKTLALAAVKMKEAFGETYKEILTQAASGYMKKPTGML